MPIVADGAVRVGADLAPFNRELRSGLGAAERQAQTFGQRMNAALSPSNIAAGLGIGFGIAQVTSFFGDAIQAAGEFEDSVSATGVIFGQEAIPALQAWADEAHSAFGASKQDALAAANQFAVFGKSAGLVGDDLTEFSTKLVQLGGDLASMFGGRTEDAIAAVGSALRGEFEPIRAYGVLLDDATLRQQAFEMGLISTTKNALTPQQRVLAAQASIFAQTSDAQGDFARTSDGLMNTQRDLAAELENVSIEVGQELLPIMLDMVTFLKDEGIPIMREFIGLLDFEDVNSAEGIPILGEIEDFLNFVDKAGSDNILEDMLHFDPEIDRAARQLGLTYQEMANRVEEGVTRSGLTQYRVVGALTRNLDAFSGATEDSAAAWNNLGQGVAATAGDIAGAVAGATEETVLALDDAKAAFSETFGDIIAGVAEVPGGIEVALKNGETIVGTSADSMMGMVSAAVERAEADAVIAASGIPGGIADALTDNAGALQPALDTMVGIMNGTIDVMIDDAEIAAAEVALAQAEAYIAANPETAAAINSQMVLVQNILDEAAIQAKVTAGLSGTATIEEQARAMALSAWLVQQEALGIVDLQSDEWERAVEIATERGYDTPEEFAAAMRQATSEVETAADEVRRAAVEPLEGIDVSAGGASLVASWVNGMSYEWNNIQRSRVLGMAGAAGRIFGQSLPTAGPLAGGVAPGGESIIESWFRGMAKAAREGMSTPSGIAAAAGAALSPASSMFPSMAAGVAGVGGAGGITYALYVNGRDPRIYDNRTDFMNALDDLGSFGDGRLG